jgi:hypothetical protein
MHTYVKSGEGWQAGFASRGPTAEHTVSPLGPVFETEAEAASLASYLNGGRWSPGELAEALPPPAEGETQAEKEEAQREKRRTAEKDSQRARQNPGLTGKPGENSSVYGEGGKHAETGTAFGRPPDYPQEDDTFTPAPGTDDRRAPQPSEIERPQPHGNPASSAKARR